MITGYEVFSLSAAAAAAAAFLLGRELPRRKLLREARRDAYWEGRDYGWDDCEQWHRERAAEVRRTRPPRPDPVRSDPGEDPGPAPAEAGPEAAPWSPAPDDLLVRQARILAPEAAQRAAARQDSPGPGAASPEAVTTAACQAENSTRMAPAKADPPGPGDLSDLPPGGLGVLLDLMDDQAAFAMIRGEFAAIRELTAAWRPVLPAWKVTA